MKTKKIEILYKNKKISINVIPCSFLKKLSGLMFTKKEKAGNLVFEFKKLTKASIHSYFVFYDFLAVWADEKNNVIQVNKVKPFTFNVSCNKKYKRLIEIPINKINRELVKIFT